MIRGESKAAISQRHIEIGDEGGRIMIGNMEQGRDQIHREEGTIGEERPNLRHQVQDLQVPHLEEAAVDPASCLMILRKKKNL
jgi:hypothetical protein